ncbi:nicotinate-nucleotide pyrophosphorylase [Mycobacterium tuberculosis RGTB423]|nr:nicotinate-nucleotide pyrophosphorylase [Mycobacterium tuberculosis RGTB423]
MLMGLSDWELAAARAAIARGLDEDLRYGPDVTTLATVPASATTTASLVTREAGVVAGLDVALLTLDEVLGTNGYRVLDRVEDGARVPPGEALMTLEAQTARIVDRRAHHVEPGRSPVGNRHRDGRVGRCCARDQSENPRYP